MYDREEDEACMYQDKIGDVNPIEREKLLAAMKKACNSIPVQTTVSDPPNVMKLTRRPVTVDFPAVPEKKRRMKVKRFEWWG